LRFLRAIVGRKGDHALPFVICVDLQPRSWRRPPIIDRMQEKPGGNRAVRPPRAACAIRHPVWRGGSTPRLDRRGLRKDCPVPARCVKADRAGRKRPTRQPDRLLALLRSNALFILCILFIENHRGRSYAKRRPIRNFLRGPNSLARA
jgi:hypothetical protein